MFSKYKWSIFLSFVVGGHVNGFDISMQFGHPNVPSDRGDILIWFNRLLNIIHEFAPKSKIILVKSPEDIHPAIQRIMGTEQKQTQK